MMTTQSVPSVPNEKTRVQLDLSSKEILRLNWIMEVCDLSTRKELFNNALTLLEWAAKEMVDGRKIASFDDAAKDRFILSMPCLNSVQDHLHDVDAKKPVNATGVDREMSGDHTQDGVSHTSPALA